MMKNSDNKADGRLRIMPAFDSDSFSWCY